jgi:hypothetical protein
MRLGAREMRGGVCHPDHHGHAHARGVDDRAGCDDDFSKFGL